ncbi:hypothetical protein FTW19_22390 [Terriglobus albidus]|uniref:Uncharacterized protein n=1 Tax=Terriglobus albidus TaxID=1592106 RepID=A0A5B9EJB5_9BACT|nr:hypothetical protein [Terriglobus albidus]QEE30491.1 hypothetical protein FTW19_22390 [Terriglobus albidus]
MKCAITATLLSVMFALSAPAETSPHPVPPGHPLADLLKQEVPKAPAPPVALQTPISDYDTLNDASYFVLGFYTFHPESKTIQPPLQILLLDKPSNSWSYLEIQGKSDADDDPRNGCLGSVVRIRSIEEKFFLETHQTPSASCQFVLSRHLKLEHILYGWPWESRPSRRVLIEGNTVHFARTHPLRLSLYDPATAVETSLLPVANDRSMKWLDDDLSDLIDDSWCRENNSPCEASGLAGSAKAFFVNDKSNAVAIDVEYIGEGMGPRAETFKAEVIYIFDLRGKALRHVEFKPDSLQKMIGDYNMEELTQPSALRQLLSH